MEVWTGSTSSTCSQTSSVYVSAVVAAAIRDRLLPRPTPGPSPDGRNQAFRGRDRNHDYRRGGRCDRNHDCRPGPLGRPRLISICLVAFESLTCWSLPSSCLSFHSDFIHTTKTSIILRRSVSRHRGSLFLCSSRVSWVVVRASSIAPGPGGRGCWGPPGRRRRRRGAGGRDGARGGRRGRPRPDRLRRRGRLKRRYNRLSLRPSLKARRLPPRRTPPGTRPPRRRRKRRRRRRGGEVNK